MKAYRWSLYSKGGVFPEEHRQWVSHQGRFYGFDKPDPMPPGLAEYDTLDYPSTDHLCRFNAEKRRFEHRIGFDATSTEENPFGTWIWGVPEWQQ